MGIPMYEKAEQQDLKKIREIIEQFDPSGKTIGMALGEDITSLYCVNFAAPKGQLLLDAIALINNASRQYLSSSQRAMLGARISETFEAEAKKRLATRKKKTERSTNSRESEKGKSAEKAAELAGASTRSTESARKVMKRGIPELVDAVEAGKIPVSVAEKIAGKPAEAQKRLLEMPKKANQQTGPPEELPDCVPCFGALYDPDSEYCHRCGVKEACSEKRPWFTEGSFRHEGTLESSKSISARENKERILDWGD
jgi:hypothetical protein